MPNKCTCEVPVPKFVEQGIYIICETCQKPHIRKVNICSYFKDDGFCRLAEQNHYSYPCRIGGEFKDCKHGVYNE